MPESGDTDTPVVVDPVVAVPVVENVELPVVKLVDPVVIDELPALPPGVSHGGGVSSPNAQPAKRESPPTRMPILFMECSLSVGSMSSPRRGV